MTSEEAPGLLHRIKQAVKDSVSPADYQSLDFSRATQSRLNADTSFFRVPFKGKSLESGFRLLQVNDAGIMDRGRIIFLQRTSEYRNAWEPYNGTVLIKT